MLKFKTPWFTLAQVALFLFIAGFVFTTVLPAALTLGMVIVGALGLIGSAVGGTISILRSPTKSKVAGAANPVRAASEDRYSTGMLGAAAVGGLAGTAMSQELETSPARGAGQPLFNVDGTPMADASFDINGDMYGAPSSLTDSSSGSWQADGSAPAFMNDLSSPMNFHD